MKRNTLPAIEAAAILFGSQFFFPEFNPEEAMFDSGAEIAEGLAEWFGFTDDDYRALAEQRLQQAIDAGEAEGEYVGDHTEDISHKFEEPS